MRHLRCDTGLRLLLNLTMGAIVATAAPAARAQDLDRVILRSGNPVVGEVKELRRGTLYFDTDEMDVVGIDWDDIAFLTSSQIFEVTDVDGNQYFGSLGPTTEEARLVVVRNAMADTVAFARVAELHSIAQGFLARTNGFVDLGANLTRANNLASILLKGRFAYKGPIWELDWNGDTYFQRQETTTDVGDVREEQTRLSTSVIVKRFFGSSWAAKTSVAVERNDELSLDNRILFMLGGQYQIIRNQSLELYAGAGAVVNGETFIGEDRTTSGEIVVTAGFDAFDIGDLDLYTEVRTFTTPSDGGRFRLNVNARLSWKIFNDFSIGVNVTEAYDSQPPTADAGRDFQYGLTIGWSWN